MLQRRIKKTTGQILVEAKAITKKQLNNALDRQRANGHCLSRHLIELDYITEDEITQHISKRYNIPYVSLSNFRIGKNLLHVIPKEISRNHGLIPLDVIGNILTIGIAEAVDEVTIKQIEELTGFKIRIMIVTAGDFNRYMQEVHELSVVDADKEREMPVPGHYVKSLSYRGKERRRFKRFNEKLKIRYEFNDEYNINSSLNISQGGILLKSKSPLPVNAHIVVRIKLQSSGEDVIIISKVARVKHLEKEEAYLIAISFSTMDAGDNKRFTEFIEFFKK